MCVSSPDFFFICRGLSLCIYCVYSSCKSCQDKLAWFEAVGLTEPVSVLASSRLKKEGAGEGKDKKTVSIEVSSLFVLDG